MARARCGPVAAATRWALVAAAIAVGALAATAPPAAACRCAAAPSMLTSYFRDRVTTVVIATPQRVVSTGPGRGRVYGLLGGPYPVNTTVYKGCARKLERIIEPLAQTSCDSPLTLGVPTLLFLSDARGYGPCDYTVAAADLTAGDVAFLSRRVAGCRATGPTCVAGNGVTCFAAPCDAVPPACAGAASCVDNYCGGCYAERYGADGQPLVCPGGGGAWGGWFPVPPSPVPTTPACDRQLPPSVA